MSDHLRDAPPTGPPPAYQTAVRRIYRGSVRWPLLVVCFASEIYLCWSGGEQIGSVHRYGFTGSLAVLAIVQGALYVAAGVIEFIGVLATATERIPLARTYATFSIVGLLMVAASQLIGIVTHFTAKQAVLNACINYNTGRSGSDWYSGWLLWGSSGGDGSDAPMNASQATTYCNSRWRSNSAGEVIGLLVTMLVGSIFVGLAFVYLRELVDPNSLRLSAPQNGAGDIPLDTPHAWHQAYAPGAGAPPAGFAAAGGAAYPPPPGPPPGDYGFEAEEAGLPKYSRDGARDADYDADRKSLNGPHGYGAYETSAPAASGSRPRMGDRSDSNSDDPDATLPAASSIRAIPQQHSSEAEEDGAPLHRT